MTKLSGILTDLQSFIGEWETAKLTQIDLRFHHYTQLTLFLSTVERTFCLYENDASEQIKNSLELTQLKQLYHELAKSLTGLGFKWESYFRF